MDLTLASESGDRSEYVSEALFSKASIVGLNLLIHGLTERYSNIKLEGRIFSELIAGLPGLKVLKIGASRQHRTLHGNLRNGFHCRGYHIESDKIVSLDVLGLPTRAYVSCKCPNLERFECGGISNGTAPNLSRNDLVPLPENISEDSIFVAPKRMLRLPYLHVPDSCEMRFQNIWRTLLEYEAIFDSVIHMVQNDMRHSLTQFQ